MSNSYKFENDTGGPEDLITGAVDIFTELNDELTEWRDGMTGSNLESSQKYSDLEEAISELDNKETPDAANDGWPHAEARITYSRQVHKRKNRSPSRQVRLDNANAMIDAVIQFYSDLDDAADHEDLIGELEELKCEAEIPGMF